ncbi:MAG TPA: UvrD-helicase domain-containing protein [Terracidiphilus sp.]|nr:UvrD-helicase domain-containing protein [Terracidiphilus sp.]
MSDRNPPDQEQRETALDTSRSVLVQAPAGSGKTDLLTRRFLRLLGEVEDPAQIVAITFTRAAAAEMRHRILSELEKVSAGETATHTDGDFSLNALGKRALLQSEKLGWQLLDLPAALRISTIDSFCREIALQQPLLAGIGGELDTVEQATELYRRAARRTLEMLGADNPALTLAIEELLRWRDNNWQEMEKLLVEMLAKRDQWMHDFVLNREPDWDALRERMEQPFANAVREGLTRLSERFDQLPGLRQAALELARYACEDPGDNSPWGLAENVEIPRAPFLTDLESARDIYSSLADFLLTQEGVWRSEKGLKTSDGFPSSLRGRDGKQRFGRLTASCASVNGLQEAFAAIRDLPLVHYTEEEWKIVRSCFLVLRHAAGELKTIFAETGKVDFIEVAQIAQRALRDEDGFPSEGAQKFADGIHHLLVDEFQDTSRRQHDLLSSLMAAWADPAGRTCFVVGDSMQSVYSFRDADAELFPRVKEFGIDMPDGTRFAFDFAPLLANFRTDPQLVDRLNDTFVQVFAVNDGSSLTYSSSISARLPVASPHPRLTLHVDFAPRIAPGKSGDSDTSREKESVRKAQIEEILNLIRGKQELIEQARDAQAHGAEAKYRVAVLGRTHKALVPIAMALREAGIPFRAVELEQLRDRPEIRDALALGRAMLNPQDRVAWLSVLRAPWCGLSLVDLHQLVSTDEAVLLKRSIPELLAERRALLSEEGQAAVARLQNVIDWLPALRKALPTAAPGTWLQQVWTRLGGDWCVDAAAQANLDLLWNCLDALPEGLQDMLGPAIDTALDRLTALPDADATGDCGVQLMTIHKAKGLEFETVIVPELQASSSRGRINLLSWLERGLAQPDNSGRITEFLVAPLQSKGAEGGKTKKWVDRVCHDREIQEMRRILYVAATRARDELHFFAQPEFADENGSPALVEPKNNLLATAWPAFQREIRARFVQWAANRAASEADKEHVIQDIAAEGSNLSEMPSVARPAFLRRLPADFRLAAAFDAGSDRRPDFPVGGRDERLYLRHEGGLLSRALGSAVHNLMEELARLRSIMEWDAARVALRSLQPAISARIRASGIHRAQAERMAAQAFDFVDRASEDVHGQWILSPHGDAGSEASWSGVVNGELRSVRVDRIFRAGLEPLQEGNDTWWIIDYKTAHADTLDAAEVSALRTLFAPQLESYAAILRALHGGDLPIRAGLYYPRMLILDWWESLS